MSHSVLSNSVLFAIYKLGEHVGNERGTSEEEALNNYFIAAGLEPTMVSRELRSWFSVRIAIEGLHYQLSHFLK